MDNKNLKPQTVQPVNCLTKQNLPAEMVELSEEDLQQVVGGREVIAPPSSCATCAAPCGS